LWGAGKLEATTLFQTVLNEIRSFSTHTEGHYSLEEQVRQYESTSVPPLLLPETASGVMVPNMFGL